MALHLLQRLPGLSVAIVDPMPEDRTTVPNHKVGEALIEWSSGFLCELGLRDHLDEHQTYKAGLNWHYAKRGGTVRSMDDYYSHFTLPAALSTWFIDVPKFETEVLTRVRRAGGRYLQGAVLDATVANGAEPHTVSVRVGAETSRLHARHLIDASGRQRILGKKLELTRMPIDGIDTSSAWVRLEGFDRARLDAMQLFPFAEDGTLHPNYFSTNHFMSEGNWMWMIPLDDEVQSLSLGIVFQNDQIPANELNTLERFVSWLARNNTLLHDLVRSGTVRDFSVRMGLSRKSRRFFSKDRWYVIGDAGILHDPMGSPGIGTISTSVSMVTELIGTDTATGDLEPAVVDRMNDFAVRFLGLLEHAFNHHDVLLGSPAANSWNVAQFYNVYFGFLLPVSLGKLHLDPDFQARFLDEIEPRIQRSLTETGELMASAMHDHRVVWSTNATNVLIYHDFYCAFDSLFGNAYQPVEREAAIACTELFLESLGLAEGQTRCLASGIRRALRHGRETRRGRHYTLGCLTGNGPISYALMCLLPLMGRRFRFRSSVPLPPFWRALLWPFTKLGVPPGLFLCRPEHLRPRRERERRGLPGQRTLGAREPLEAA